MDAAAIDQIHLNFNAQGLFIINAAIGLMMLGVALEMKVGDFKRILVSPKAPAIGLIAQFILLPAFTYLLVLVLEPAPSIALGMMMVAACPGGNLSNIITYMARGNTALSVSMTAVSTAAAIVMTPFNLAFWGSLNPGTAAILREVRLSPVDVFMTVFVILGIPLIIGMTIGNRYPTLAEKVRRPFKIFTLVFFLIIVLGALAANWQNFLNYVGIVVFAVFLHNLLALNLGYWSAWSIKLPVRDRRAISIEVGIQNSALGLVLIFTFFGGLGGMALVAAWWGIWHIISGLSAAFLFSRKKLPPAELAAEAE
ncbi:MAG TPA: bile acid:sodium symporter family protein [Spirochaetota bacterium]|nr:bile acid:sodium symporter family protein [Spirochaetota bacterium]